jgi:bifunctional UDP-N-acetylglucosamine pyrophosphorylase/glucosamine-1-phosphate N-acetyltransferase
MTASFSFSGDMGAVIFAAGQGTRMHAKTPKVLQRILEEPMLRYVRDAVIPLCGGRMRTVIGHGASAVREAFPGQPGQPGQQEDEFVLQPEQLGTGHALQTAWPEMLALGVSHVLVINGDTPLVTREVLADFLGHALAAEADIAFLSLDLEEPGDFGRVVRRKGEAAAIVEAKEYDVSVHGPEPTEVNAGMYCFRTAAAGPLLPLLSPANKGGEVYVTDLVGLGVSRGLKVYGHRRLGDRDLLGINTPLELALAEERLRERLVAAHLRRGVIIHSPHMVRIGPDVRLEPGVEITGPCEFYGDTRVAAGARIASHCRLHAAEVAEDVIMHSFCHVAGARIGPRCIVGPYARLRPGAALEEGAHVGNFVEMKMARLGKGAKANHLAYLGDAEVGAGANIGAGTITCNYDGKSKHRTTIGEDAFIGSNSALVAPVTVGAGALVGAGSVITRNVPDGQIGITRPEQRTLPRRGRRAKKDETPE